jgi:hypothetical protein
MLITVILKVELTRLKRSIPAISTSSIDTPQGPLG